MRSVAMLFLLIASVVGNAGEKHWAFQPVRNPPLPPVRQASWPQTPVDRFVLAKLEASGLSPAASTKPQMLVRRLYLDLIGLPPTPDEVDAFIRESTIRNPQSAIAQLVDRLLASPHFGERWGRYWLDVARYADTKGYVFFEENDYPFAWTYRDYVVRSLNEDVPYDRFIVEQIAADLLPLGGDKQALAALGFITVGGRFMNNPHDILDDRIDAVTRGLMGLTVTCARCHDHKYDPIPTSDYYSLYGVFASCAEPPVPPLFTDPPRTEQYVKFEKELKERERKLAEFMNLKRDAVMKGAKTRVAEYLMAAYARRNMPAADDFMLLADGSDLNPLMILRWQRYLQRMRTRPHAIWSLWHALADLPEAQFAEQAGIVCNQCAKSSNPRLAGVFATPPKTMTEVAQRYSTVLNLVEKRWLEMRVIATIFRKPMPAAMPDPIEEELRQVFHAADAPPNLHASSYNDLDLLPDRPAQEEMKKFLKAVEEWRAKGPGAPPRAMTVQDLPKLYDPRIFQRGNPNQLGDHVPRQFVSILSGGKRQPFSQGSGRHELARAIASKDNPLTARVLVNRVWMHHFGTPLVATPGDFGTRSDPPTHPELLDWLASDFMAHGWSLKHLHRRIVLSATYQQTSIADFGLRNADSKTSVNSAIPNPKSAIPNDPDNSLLGHANRRRLDFESLRDSVLAVSGRLDATVGGQPQRDMFGDKGRRRTLYGFIDRLNLPGLHRSFDFPSPDASCAARSQTTVPQQALFLMNHNFTLNCARGLLQRPDVVTADSAAKVRQLYRLAFGREPSDDETKWALEFVGSAKTPALGWELCAQALLLSNEFAFVD